MSRAIARWDTRETSTFRHAIAAGLVTSMVAGLIMAVVMGLVFAIVLGKGPFYPVQVIGSVAFGESALNGFQLDAFVTGLMVHLCVALAWGVVFSGLAAALALTSIWKSMVAGVAVAIVSMIDVYSFVPAIMTGLQGVDIWNREVPIGWDWAAHLVYGLSFGFYPLIARSLYPQG